MISAFYFTLGSQTVLELALWCLFFTVLVSLIFAFENKAKHNNSFKESLIGIVMPSVGSGIFCFVGLYLMIFQGYY